MKFRKKPVVIEAMQFDGTNTEACCRFIGRENISSCGPGEYIGIYTLEGVMVAAVGDWIIEEPFPTSTRKFYPCKPDIFAATYEMLAAFTPAEPPQQEISIDKLPASWDGDPPSYAVSDEQEGIVLCLCWLPDVADRIRQALTGAETVVVHRGQLLDRISLDGRDHFFDKDGVYDGWGACAVAPAEPQTPEPEITPVARAVLAVHEARQDILNFVSRYLDLDRAAAMTDALIAAVEARAKIDVDTMATLKAAWEKRAYEAEAALEPAAPVSPEAHLLTTEAAAFKAGWQERGVDDWSHPPAWGGVENALAAYRSSQAGSVNK